ncbi:MAG: TrkH family potassium uptake protein, partial [Bacteroidales bacterium]|nr:TrkH family potassium uptake protein [Bacteroidales bacterium]
PERWPFLVSAITFALIILGASAGSTGGGLKIKRVMILVRYVRNYFTRMLHPNAVFVVTMDEHRIDDDYINKIFGFVFMYIMFIVLGAFVLTITGLSIPTAVCVAATNIANLGPSPLIDMMGAQFDYASLMPLAKWTLIALMLVGRIEIFAILAIFSPAYWRR